MDKSLLSTRDGITLTELVVLPAIAILLIAVLVPAVDQARRSQCRNQFKNLELAFQNYTEVHRVLNGR